MGLFSFLTAKRKVNVPQIGKLLILKSPEGNVLGGKSYDERVGNPFEIYFNVQDEELISGQLEIYASLLDGWAKLMEEIKVEVNKTEAIEEFQAERILVAEPYDEGFDVDINFISADKEFSVTIKNLGITEIRFLEM